MFTKIGPNEVRSSDGYRVAVAKRLELHYEDQLGLTVVAIEPMSDGELVVGRSAIEAGRRSVITDRIDKALSFLGITHSFE